MPNRQCIPSLLFKPVLAGLILLCLAAASDMPIAQERGQGVRRPVEAKPEQRVALVIGNADYKEAKLANPANDARDMAAALRGVGFEVLSGEDRNSRQMKELIRQFGQKLRAGGVGVFYFAGHGVQVSGRNYLIPVGAEINSEAEVEYEAVELGFVLAQLEEARNRLNVVILDACRNNPYARSFRSGSRGLAGVRNAPSGTLIAYATAADDVASDGGGRNGLYTGELLAQIKRPGVTLSQVFQRTRTSVRSKSQGKQVPYEYTSVEGDEDFYFIPPNAPPPVVSAEQQAWERVKQLRSLETVRGFLSLYPNSPFEKEAQALLAMLEKGNPSTAPVSIVAPSGTTGESEVAETTNLRPTILYREKAPYTKIARTFKIEGTVILSVVYLAEGKIGDIEVIQGLPHGLTESAIEATKKIKFTPAMKNGKPVSIKGKIEFQFKL